MAVRLAAPFIVVSVFVLAIGIAAGWYVHGLERNMADLLTRGVSSARASKDLVIAASRIETQLDQYLVTGQPDALDEVPPFRDVTHRWLDEVQRLAESDSEREHLRAIEEAHARFWEGFAVLNRKARSADVRRELRELSSLVLTRGLRIPLQDYLDEQEGEVEDRVAANQMMPGRIAFGLQALGTCGAVAGVLAGLGVARGVSRSFAQLSVPVHDAAGKLSEVVGPITLSPVRDVAGLEEILHRLADEIGTVVERLESSRRETLRSEQLALLGQWAAGLAHELRNPLTSMKILVQTAVERSKDGGPGLQGRSLAILEEEIARLEGLLQSFLDFARPAAIEPRAIDPVVVAEGILALTVSRVEAQAISIECEFPDKPLVLFVDPVHLRQLLLNLLLNALDATPADGRISLRIAREPAERGSGFEAVIEVEDDGPGLPAGLGDRVFEPFVSTKTTGLGLGLSICRRIVEAHGGTIAAVNRPEGGARFTVRLPLDESRGLSQVRKEKPSEDTMSRAIR